jgi:hypothetical protein
MAKRLDWQRVEGERRLARPWDPPDERGRKEKEEGWPPSSGQMQEGGLATVTVAEADRRLRKNGWRCEDGWWVHPSKGRTGVSAERALEEEGMTGLANRVRRLRTNK